jgi:hypothetical protein
MLLQSHESISTKSNGSTLTMASTGTIHKVPLIRLLPAIPDEFKNMGGGYFKGLLARGGFEVDAAWDQNGELTKVSILSKLGGTAYVTVGGIVLDSAGLVNTAPFGNVTSGNFTVGRRLKSRSTKTSDALFLKLETEKGKRYAVMLA